MSRPRRRTPIRSSGGCVVLIALRQRYKAFGRGSLEILLPENRKVFAFIRRWGTSASSACSTCPDTSSAPTGPVGVPRRRPRRALRKPGVPADRRPPLLHHTRIARVLLVLPGVRARAAPDRTAFLRRPRSVGPRSSRAPPVRPSSPGWRPTGRAALVRPEDPHHHLGLDRRAVPIPLPPQGYGNGSSRDPLAPVAHHSHRAARIRPGRVGALHAAPSHSWTASTPRR